MSVLTFKEYKKFNKEDKFFRKNIDTLFGKYVFSELTSIAKKLKLKKIDEAHDIFAHSNYFGCSIYKSRELLIEEADGGVDSFWFDEDKGKLFLVQTKLCSIHKNFLSQMETSYRKYIKGETKPEGDARGLEKIKKYLNKKPIKTIEYICIQPGSRDDSFGDNKRILGWNELLKEAVDNINKEIRLNFKAYSQDAGSEKPTTELENIEKIVLKVKINDLIAELDKFNDITKETLFNANVRGDVATVDFKKGFKKTLQEEPQNFSIYNNGITFIVDDIKTFNELIDMKNPQIINGQQTTRNLMAISSSFDILDDAEIYIKVIKTSDPKLVMNIAKYSNSQSSVKTGDLISATNEFKELNKSFMAKGFYLDAKPGKSIRKIIYGKMKLKNINISDLIKIYIATRRPDLMHSVKASIGKVKKNFIEGDEFSKMDISLAKFSYELLKIKDEYKKHFVQSVDSMTINDEEKKAYMSAFSFAEIAIYRMIHNKYSKEMVSKKIIEYKDGYKGDSLIQAFKSKKAYKEMGLL